jgi:hypothetical protein
MEKLTDEKIIKLQNAIEAGDVKIKWGYEVLSLITEVLEGRKEMETPKPAWSSTLPTESGWYWWRDPKERGASGKLLKGIAAAHPTYIEIGGCFLAKEEAFRYEWWPIPLTAPED